MAVLDRSLVKGRVLVVGACVERLRPPREGGGNAGQAYGRGSQGSEAARWRPEGMHDFIVKLWILPTFPGAPSSFKRLQAARAKMDPA